MATRKQNYVGAPKGNQNAKGRGKTAGAAVGAATAGGAVHAVGAALSSKKPIQAAVGSGSISFMGKKTAAGVSAGGVLGGGIKGGQVAIGASLAREVKVNKFKAGGTAFASKRVAFNTSSLSIPGKPGLKARSFGATMPASAAAGLAGAALGTAAGAGYNQYKKRRSKKT
jgi:hypothetical protein